MNRRITLMTSKLTPNELASHVAERLPDGQRRHWEVLAVPGSGKTQFLIHLLIALLKHGVQPEAILVLSFANSTVNVIDKRAAKARTGGDLPAGVSTDLREVRSRTFHSFAKTVLPNQSSKILLGDDVLQHVRAAVKRVARKYIKHGIEEGEDARVDALHELLDDDDAQELLLKVFDLARATGQSMTTAAEHVADDLFSDLKTVLPSLLAAYVASLARSGSTDFAQMLQDACDRGKMPAYDYVLIDEYQDCTAAQRLIIKKLAAGGARIVAVGDNQQALYGFAGAEPARLKSLLPLVEESHLNRSYRLTRENAALANAIGGLTGADRIRTHRDNHGPKPVFTQHDTYWECLDAVVRRVEELIADGVALHEIAILGRTNQLLKDCEDHLLRQVSINTRRNGFGNYPDAVKTVIAIASLIRNQARADAESISVADITRVWAHGAVPDATRIANGMPKLKLAFERAKSKPRARLNNIFRPCIDAFLIILGRKGKNFKELRNEVMKWEPIAAQHTSASSLLAKFTSLEGSKVVTSTFHRSKGMEWKHVLIVGMTEGFCPIFYVRPGDEKGLQQERNALFVAVTRAIVSNTLFHAPRHHPRSRRLFDQPSQFLAGGAVTSCLEA